MLKGALNETSTAINTLTHSRRMRTPYTILAAQSVLVREIKMQQTEDEVATDLGQRIEAALVVWAAGVKAPEVVSKLDGLEVNHRGQIVVRPTLQSKEDDSVFALGDSSSFSGVDGRPLP